MENILQTLNIKDIQRIRIITLKKGETLYREGDKCLHVGVIKDGSIKIASYTFEGREVIYRSLREGDIFGNNLIFSDQPFYRGDVIATADTTVYLFDQAALLETLQGNIDFLIEFLKEESNFGKSLNLSVKLLTFNNAEERLMYFLSINRNRYSYKSITDLANTLFLSREVVSRTIHKLEKQRIIKIDNKTIIKNEISR